MMKTFLFILLLSTSQQIMACSCAPQPEDHETGVKEAFKQSSSIVLAEAQKVVESTSKMSTLGNYETDELESQITYFSEIQSWKGNHGKQFRTEIIVACCVCGIRFKEGEQYLLYLYKEDGSEFYATNICSRTKHISHAGKDIKVLNRIASNELHK